MRNARTKQDAAEGRNEAARCRRTQQSGGSYERSFDEQRARKSRRSNCSQHHGAHRREHEEGDQGDAGGEAGRGALAARTCRLRSPAEGRRQAIRHAGHDRSVHEGPCPDGRHEKSRGPTSDDPHRSRPSQRIDDRQDRARSSWQGPHAAGGNPQDRSQGPAQPGSSRGLSGLPLKVGPSGRALGPLHRGGPGERPLRKLSGRLGPGLEPCDLRRELGVGHAELLQLVA